MTSSRGRVELVGMGRTPWIALAFVLWALVLSCARVTPAAESAAGAPAPSPTELAAAARSSSPTPTPAYQPGPNFTTGTVISRSPTGMIIASVGTQQEVDLRSVADVWKETSVPAAAIELGDQVDVNGTGGQAVFVARYVWVNIGRLDGVIRAIETTGMTVATQRPGDVPRERRVDFSAYLEVVKAGPNAITPATRADLAVGLSVGMVLYRPPGGIPRATRIWLSGGP